MTIKQWSIQKPDLKVAILGLVLYLVGASIFFLYPYPSYDSGNWEQYSDDLEVWGGVVRLAGVLMFFGFLIFAGGTLYAFYDLDIEVEEGVPSTSPVSVWKDDSIEGDYCYSCGGWVPNTSDKCPQCGHSQGQ